MSFQYPSDSYRVPVKVVLLVNNKLLLVKEDTGLWDLPGGGIEHGEMPQEALHRELKEEIGIDVPNIYTELVRAWPTYDPIYKKPVMVLICDHICKIEIDETELDSEAVQLCNETQFNDIVLQRHMEKYREQIASMAYKKHLTKSKVNSRIGGNA